MIYYHRLPFVPELTKQDICREPIAAFFMSLNKTRKLSVIVSNSMIE
jgi:hypothetical protein